MTSRDEDHEVGALAGLDAAHLVLHERGVGGVEGEPAEGLGARERLVPVPPAGRGVGGVLARDGGVEPEERVDALDGEVAPQREPRARVHEPAPGVGPRARGRPRPASRPTACRSSRASAGRSRSRRARRTARGRRGPRPGRARRGAAPPRPRFAAMARLVGVEDLPVAAVADGVGVHLEPAPHGGLGRPPERVGGLEQEALVARVVGVVGEERGAARLPSAPSA